MDNKSSVRSFKVDVSYAKDQASKASFKSGKSGDPHAYHGGDNISWGVNECDFKDAPLFEYPVFWVSSGSTAMTDVTTDPCRSAPRAATARLSG
jgi:hypothetical protein